MVEPNPPAAGPDSAVRNPHPAFPQAPLIVLSGPSGVGKTTLVDALLRRTSLPLRRAVTATTRTPRPGEVPEESYHFWTHDQFREAIAQNEMLEWAEVHGRDFYGTPRSEVDPYRGRGVGVILVIDVQGAGQIRARYPGDHLSVFVYPPTFEDLERRLRGRGEAEESIRRRLATAHQELARRDEYDHALENGELEAAAAALEAIIRDEFKRRGC
jgi:guanylate kinase